MGTRGAAALFPDLEQGNLEFDATLAVSPDGNVACIGGWLAVRTGRSAIDYMSGGYSPALWDLFWPDLDDRIPTSLQAARAIENFLTTGSPQWDRSSRLRI